MNYEDVCLLLSEEKKGWTMAALLVSGSSFFHTRLVDKIKRFTLFTLIHLSLSLSFW